MKRSNIPTSDETIRVTTVFGEGKLPLTDDFHLQYGNKSVLTKAACSPHIPYSLMGTRDQRALNLLPQRRARSFHAQAILERPSPAENAISETPDASNPTTEIQAVENTEDELRSIVEAIPVLNDAEKARLISILIENKEAWSNQGSGRVRTKAHFEVKGKPFKARSRHFEPAQLAEMKKQLTAQLAAGVIRESTSEWSAAPHFVQKANGEWRMVIDYRHLNDAMTSDNYPLPRLWDTLQKVAGHKYYICLDITAGFWNIPLEESCKHYTSFVTPFGTFEFNVLPFGIKNAPSIFQRTMDTEFEPVLVDDNGVYLDDIILSGDVISQLLDSFDLALKLCINAGLPINLRKLKLFFTEVEALGHVISEKGIRPSPKKLDCIASATSPTSYKQLQQFLGLAGYIRPFVPNYAQHAHALTELLKKQRKVRFEWNADYETAYNTLKHAVTSAIRVTVPVVGAPYIIETDASDVGVGAILKQVQDGEEVPLECASKKLSDVQTRWDTREKELWAIIWAIERWRDYVQFTHFTVRTDHNNLRYLTSVDCGKVFRWALWLAQFDFNIVFLSGENNAIADWLSRYSNLDTDDTLIDTIAVPIYHVGILRKPLQLPKFSGLQDLVTSYKKMGSNALDQLTIQEGLLRVHPTTKKVFVPEDLREKVMIAFHYGVSGHLGSNRTLRRLRQYFFWPSMAKEVQEFIAACPICVRIKGPPLRRTVSPQGTLNHPVALDLVSLDHVSISCGDSEKYILVMIDHTTRFLVASWSNGLTALETKNIFFSRWVSYFGIPRLVLTDNHGSFKSVFSDAITSLGCKHLLSAVYRPQGNGLNEASHKSLKMCLSALWQEGYHENIFNLWLAQRLHNTTPHVSLGTTPFHALYGRQHYERGLQDLTLVESEEQRQALLEARHRDRLQRQTLLKQEVEDVNIEELKVGDTVVAKLTSGAVSSMIGLHDVGQLSPLYSMPLEVRKVTNTQVGLRRLGRLNDDKLIYVHQDDVKKFKKASSPLLHDIYKQYEKMQVPTVEEFQTPNPITPCIAATQPRKRRLPYDLSYQKNEGSTPR